MSQWAERFRSHQIWQLLQTLGPVIDQALNREGVDPQTIEGLARLQSVLAFTGKRLAGADPYLFQNGPLDSLSTAIQGATSEVQAYVANGTPAHIVNANVQADTALACLVQLNVPLTTEDLLAAKEAAETYRRGLDKSLSEAMIVVSQFRSEFDTLRSRVTELTNDVAAERQRLSLLASEHQSQFSSAQEVRNREYADAQMVRQEKFAAILDEYSQRLTDQNSESIRQREAIARQHQVEIEELKKQFLESVNDVRDEIFERKREVEKLVGIIGNLGVTSGYQKAANEARRTVRVWQVVAVLSMLGLIALAYRAFLPIVEGGFSWSSFAGRVFVSLTVGALAAYAASQADKYQKIERRNRKLALELEAIGPYIAPLPQDKQEEFRLTIGDRSFGHNDEGMAGLNEKSPATVVDLLVKSKEFRDFITEIVKAAK